MSHYVYGSGLSYTAYLQQKSFEDGIRSEISSASRSIIASNEELAREQITVLSSMSSKMERGLERLSFDMQSVSDGIAELNSTFSWGFSEMLILMGGLNDSLHELIRIAKTPEQTWAYEQFEIARDAFRQELYEDAIQYLNRAINGYGGHTGYNLEYRFHYLLGAIHLGSFKNSSGQMLNLPLAEQAFLNAAKYARRDRPKDAARGYLAAGWAAYCHGNMQDSERHTRDALALNDSLPEAHFQLAKLQMHQGTPEGALVPLRSAIMIDRGYTIKACADGDFTPYQQLVDSLLETLRQEARDAFQRSVYAVETEIARLEASRTQEFPLASEDPIHKVRQIRDTIVDMAKAGTYYGYLDALDFHHSSRPAISKASQALRQTHQEQLDYREALRRQKEEKEAATRNAFSEKARSKADTALWLSLGGILCFPLSPVGLVYGIQALTAFGQGGDQKGRGKATTAVVIGGLWVALIVLSIFSSLIERR